MRQANFKPEVNLHTSLVFKGEIINKKSKGTKQAEASEKVRGLTRHIILAIKKQMPNPSFSHRGSLGHCSPSYTSLMSHCLLFVRVFFCKA